MALDEILIRVRFAEDEIDRTRAVEELSDHEGEQVIRALIDALGDEDDLVRSAAARGLKRSHLDPAPYLRTALSDKRLWVRWGATELLVHHPSGETEAALRSALGDESPHVRGAAARSLRGMVREPSTITELRKLLDDPDGFPRYQALLTLRAVDPGLVDEARIIQRDLRSHDALTQVAAIHFIREDHKHEWLPEVENLLDHPDFRVRRAATWAWERLRNETT